MLERLYRKYGLTYVVGCLVLRAIGAWLFAMSMWWGLHQLVPQSHLNFVVDSLSMAGLGGLALAASAYLASSKAKPWLDWVKSGRPDEGADAAWRTAIHLWYTLVSRELALGSIVTIVFIGYSFREAHLGMNTWLAFVPIGVLGVFSLIVFNAFTFAALMRPAVTECGHRASVNTIRPPWVTGLRIRTIAAVSVTTVFSAFTAIAVAPIGRPGTERLLGTLGLAAGIGLTYTACLTFAIAESMAAPIRDLIAGTVRVGQGDLTQRVPVTTEDEIGQLAGAFNEMASGVREAELLRARLPVLNLGLESALADLQASQSRLVAATDEERRRLERDLHDGAQQSLVLIRLELHRLSKFIAGEDAEPLLDRIATGAKTALEQLRDLAHGIYPSSLSTDGLTSALEELADRTRLEVAIDCEGVGRLRGDVEAAVYFCCAEALVSATKHSGTDASLSFRLRVNGDSLTFDIHDNGAGFETEWLGPAGGVQKIVDRVGAIGGRVSVRSSPDSGTSVSGSVPVATLQDAQTPTGSAI